MINSGNAASTKVNTRTAIFAIPVSGEISFGSSDIWRWYFSFGQLLSIKVESSGSEVF
jgi:hypothetical protein